MIFVTGDTHGTLDFDKLQKFSESEKELTKDDYLVISGDFGGVWDGGNRDEVVLKKYERLPCTVLFVDGNHENFFRLNSYPVEQWHGGKVHIIRKDVIHLMRGQIYEIEGKSFFTFGGGLSIDRFNRIPGISWWPEEEPSDAECKEALENIKAHGNRVDYVITHACPKYIKRNLVSQLACLIDENCKAENFLEEVDGILKYDTWFFGHYHIEAPLKEFNMRALYHDIVKIR